MKYHCGLNTKPFTRFATKLICFWFIIATHGAWSVTSLSTCAHWLLAAVWSVRPVWPAWSIFDWMAWLQNAAMFGLELLFGWNEPQPRRMSRKSEAAG